MAPCLWSEACLYTCLHSSSQSVTGVTSFFHINLKLYKIALRIKLYEAKYLFYFYIVFFYWIMVVLYFRSSFCLLFCMPCLLYVFVWLTVSLCPCQWLRLYGQFVHVFLVENFVSYCVYAIRMVPSNMVPQSRLRTLNAQME